ncbi:MAG: RNA 2'-phosphotransferase [Thermodesulfobacteriota bacterium]
MDRHQTRQLERLLIYILGHRPDEFGLVLDQAGWLPAKELLRAVQQEPGWAFLRDGLLKDLLLTSGQEEMEVSEDGRLVRARRRLPLPVAASRPAVLFAAVRPRAYAHVRAEGLAPAAGRSLVVLARTEELARCIGRRRDPEPVIVRVDVQAALAEGVVFQPCGETLFLADRLPATVLTGPPLPKTREKAPSARKTAPEPVINPFRDLIGSAGDNRSGKGRPGKSGPAWKKERRRKRDQDWF